MCLIAILAIAVLLPTARAVAEASDVVANATDRLDAGDRRAALELLECHLALMPGDGDARYLYARILAWEQQWAASLEQYDRLLRVTPTNVDYLLGKSQALVWSQRPADALPLLAQARQLAPEYEAVRTLEARALHAVNEPQQHALPANHVEAGFSTQTLSGDLPGWTNLYVQGGRQLGRRKSIYGQLRQTERFNERDHEIAAGFYWPFGDAWTASADASLAAGAVVLPEWTIAAQMQRSFQRGLGIQAGIRHSEYASNYVRMLTLIADYYWRNYYTGWTVYLGKLEGADPTVANQWRVDRYYGARNRIGILLAAGKETESAGNGIFVTGDTFSAAMTGLHWLGPVWGVSWDLVFHEQGDAYRRGGFRVGLRRQF